MVIAVNTRFLLKDRLEGIGWFTYETLRRLVEWHPEHQFIFFFDRPFDEKFVFAENVKPIVLFPPARHPFLFYLWFEYAIPKALKKNRADVFLSPDGFLSLKTDVPTLLVIHDLAHIHFPHQVKYWEQKYYNFFMPKFAKKARRIITVSKFSKQDIHQQYDIPLTNIDVVYNGVREDFQPLTEATKVDVKAKYANGKDYFFYIGAIHPRKNVHRLITAFDQFKQSNNADMKLLIAGRFAWQTGLEKTAFEQAIHKKDIHFLNYMKHSEVSLLMGSALGFVYVSLFEGFGIPLLEAMKCEVPIITANVSSMPEVVGKAGIIVNPESVEAIQSAMNQLYSNKKKRMELVEFGKKQREKFSWKKTATQLQNSLKKIITLFLLICLMVNCNPQTKKRNIRSFYYPIENFKAGKIYEYQAVNDSLAPFYWKFHASKINGATILTSEYFDHNQVIQQHTKEEIVKNGVTLNEFYLYETDTLTGKQIQNPVKIETGNVFPYEVTDSMGLFLYKIYWTDYYNPNQKYRLIRNRHFMGDASYIFKGKKVACVQFLNKELLEIEEEGFQELRYNSIELYAKNIGLIYFRKEIGGNIVQEYELTDILDATTN